MPAQLTNPFVSYTDRSYEQVVAALLAKYPSFLPEITDYTDGNDLIRMSKVWAGLMEQMHWYLDRNTGETYLALARLFPSMVRIARQFDYRVKGRKAAIVNLRFFITNPAPSDITIPAGTRVTTPLGVQFRTLAQAVILTGETEAETEAAQRVLVTGDVIGVSSGLADQELELSMFVEHNSVTAVINGDTYTGQQTLVFSTATDTHFIGGLAESGNYAIQFGDGISGVIPTPGFNVVADYFSTQGLAGNVGTGTISEFVDAVPTPIGVTLFVTNDAAANGGADGESVAELRKRIPAFLRTLDRAVTFQDYQDIAEQVQGVAKANVSFTCGKTVDVYIAPTGGGLATDQLLQDVLDYFEPRRMVTTRVNVLPAGVIRVLLTMDVRVRAGYNQAATGVAVKQALADFISVGFQDIGGEVQIGDIYEVAEGVEGVQYTKLVLINTVPYARRLNLALPTELDWTRATQPASNSVVRWEIRMVAPALFDLFRDNTFMGNIPTGVLVAFPEVQFTVNAVGYAGGERYEFYTYPYNDSVVLTEKSIPFSEVTDITLNLTGGI